MSLIDYRARGPGQVRRWLLCVLLMLFAGNSLAQQTDSGGQVSGPASVRGQLEDYQTGVWLVTYGPGELYWQRFGHNGIWIRDQDLGLDHIFNFGFFDFAQEDFFLRFLQGRMLYFSAAQPAESEFAQYIDENRSIRLQKLALSEEQALRLADFLVREVQSENRDYLYDYYWNNCSTRVRDALDMALGGQLSQRFSTEPAGQNFRGHTRRLTAGGFWLYLGLELVLGRPVDQDISRWNEFFIPGELAAGIAGLPAADGLLQEDLLLYESSLQPPPASAPLRWPVYLLLSALLTGLVTWLLSRFSPGKSAGVGRAWLVFSGLAGSAMVFFWFGTDHAVAAANFNLLLFNPLFLLVIIQKLRRQIAWLVVAAGLLGLLQSLLPAPPGQYSADVVAAFLPINLWAAWQCLRAFPQADRVGRA